MSDTVADPSFHPPEDAVAFYDESLRLLKESGVPFLLSGTYAVTAYTGIRRPTKDLDVFCKPGDYPRILAYFQARGDRTDVEDERWIAKVWKDDKHFFDVIFAMSNGTIAVNDAWFGQDTIEVYGHTVSITPPTALILSKVFIQDRYRYDGADVNHIILKQSDAIDWKSLLNQMDLYWEVLMAHLLNYRFAYPTERQNVPAWLMHELTERLRAQVDLPAPRVKVCRGRLFSARDYISDVAEWGYGDVVGKGLEERHEAVH
jgi:hypothetical protein